MVLISVGLKRTYHSKSAEKHLYTHKHSKSVEKHTCMFVSVSVLVSVFVFAFSSTVAMESISIMSVLLRIGSEVAVFLNFRLCHTFEIQNQQ